MREGVDGGALVGGEVGYVFITGVLSSERED
jgi:hypothetical protein